MLIDLHRHLEGSIRPATAVELAHAHGHPLAGLPDPESELVAHQPLAGLLPYLAKIETAASTVRTASEWQRVAAEAVQDAAADGVDYLELRFAPHFVEAVCGLPAAEVVEAVSDAATAAGRRHGVGLGLIGIVVRDRGPQQAEAQLATLLARRDLFVAVDLAGDEAGVPAHLFAPAFRRVRDAGLHVTVHAGEAAGPASVAAALDHLGAERIGHGVRAAEDARLMERLAREEVTLEVALTSNVHTGAAVDLAHHPVRSLLGAGVRVALSTDNPTVSGTTLSREHSRAAVGAGLSDRQRQDLAAQAAAAAFGRLPG